MRLGEQPRCPRFLKQCGQWMATRGYLERLSYGHLGQCPNQGFFSLG
jgi:hypothetical protein